MGGKIKGYTAPKTREIKGKTHRLEQSTNLKSTAESIKRSLKRAGWNVSVLPAPKSSQYNWEVYKRKK